MTITPFLDELKIANHINTNIKMLIATVLQYSKAIKNMNEGKKHDIYKESICYSTTKKKQSTATV